MKKGLLEFRLILFLFLFIFIFSDLKSQTLQNQGTIVSIKRIRSFPVHKPPPQSIVEIRNDMGIHFYNILPIDYFQKNPSQIDEWAVDTTTIQMDSTEFKLLEKKITEINFENIDRIEKPKSENGIEIVIVGGVADTFIIELTNQKVEFGYGANNKDYVSESAKMIRNIFEELEKKYKPKK